MNTQQFYLAGIGEVLMDRFEDGEVTIGGAPFNLTFHLHQLLIAFGRGSAVMISAIGNDFWGESILSRMKATQMDTGFIQIKAQHATGSAKVFTHVGEAGFEILPDVAWDFIEELPELQRIAPRCEAIAFGSLAQRSPMSKHTIQKFIEQVPGHRLYDVNLRRNTTNDMAGYTAEIIEQSLQLATVVKMNDAELEEVTKLLSIPCSEPMGEMRSWQLMETLKKRYLLAAVTVTRGPKGALLLGDHRRLQLADSSVSQDQVHPVGAGDAFSAGLLFGLVQKWDLTFCAQLAELLASWVVTHTTATPTLTSSVIARIQDIISQAEPIVAAEELSNYIQRSER